MAIVNITGNDGDGGLASLSFDDAHMAGSGGMKDVYFSPCKKYVVGFYKKPQDYSGKERVKKIVGDYRKNLFGGPNGSYWKDYFCWPTHWVEHNGKFGVVVPTYQKHFFFKVGSKKNDMLGIKGKEKQGKWFASASHQKKYLATEERGEWINYIQFCIRIARATRRMHAEGLAHSDLSYKNCLVAPTDGSACLIDIDGLVVPGKFPPDVSGTPGFIAPEVVATLKLPLKAPNKALANRKTDLHALAVLIYNYLLYRHPLEGRKVHDPQDTDLDVELQMGQKALFVDHPKDKSNRPNPADCRKESKPFCDVDKIPYTITGPY